MLKQQLPITYAVAIAAAFVLAVGFFGFRMLSGQSEPQAPSSVEMHSMADKLTLKCGGDFSKLTPEEQITLDNMTLGHGKKYVEIHFPKLSNPGGK